MSTQIREVGTDGLTRRVPTPASQPGDTFPAGIIQMWAGPTPPSGWLFCDGSEFVRATYPTLFANIGTTWGAGNGSTTANLPNFHDCMPIGAGNLYALAGSGGEATHALSITEIPIHNHSVNIQSGTQSANHTHNVSMSVYALGSSQTDAVSASATSGPGATAIGTFTAGSTAESGTHSHAVVGNTGTAGGVSAHNNLPPYKGIHFIIRAY